MECILNKVDPLFDATLGFEYRLSILLGQDGFSFLVTHAVSRQILKMASYSLKHLGIHPEETNGWPQSGNEYFAELRKLEYAQIAWQRVEVAIASQKFTIAPHGFMENGDDMNIISAAFPVAQAEQILSEPVFDLGPVTSQLIPGYISEYCSAIFPGCILRNASAVFVKGILRKHSHLIARQVFINIHHGFFEITVIQGLRLLYLNAFRYMSPSDVLYYVIFVLEQLGFVPSEEKVTLMGEIAANSTIFLQLKMYCGSLNFITKPVELEYGEVFEEIGMHNYFTLLNMPICE